MIYDFRSVIFDFSRYLKLKNMEARPGFEPGMEVLQTSALATWRSGLTQIHE